MMVARWGRKSTLFWLIVQHLQHPLARWVLPVPRHIQCLRLLPRLDEARKFLKCHPPAGFVVGGCDPRWQVVVYGQHPRAAVRISQRERDCHLAAHREIGCLELHDFDHLLIRHELDEATMAGVGVRGRLAGCVRRVAGERNAVRTSIRNNLHATVAGFKKGDCFVEENTMSLPIVRCLLIIPSELEPAKYLSV